MKSAAITQTSQFARATSGGNLLEYARLISDDFDIDFSRAFAPQGRANAVADDYRDSIGDTTAPFGVLTAGSSRTGNIETSGDRDVFSIQLTAGQTYTFNLNRGSGTGLADPILGLFSASGAQIATNDDFGGSRNSQITYTANASGTFYLTAQGYQSGTGSYTLSSTGRPPAATDDYRDSVTDTTAPFGTLTVGTTSTGRIETSGDADVFALSVTAGQTYTINLNAAASGGLADPVMRLLNASGGQIAVNDDFGGGRNSQISYTATSTGTVYVEAKGYQTGTGNYTVSATGSTPAPVDDFRDSLTDTTAPFGAVTVGAAAATGRIESGGDADIFAVTLAAGQTYSFALNSAASGGLGDPTLRLLNASGTQLAANNDSGGTANSLISFTATSGGTYYLEAKGAVATATGNYTLAATNTTAPATGGFDIVIRYTGDQQYQALFEQAAARWEKVITGDLPDFMSRTNGLIDDLLIDAGIIAIDGRGGTLAQAGAREFRPASQGGLAASGIMQFDVADVGANAADGSLFGIILHEMGHILGFSATVFQRMGLSDGGTHYTGNNALAEYRALTGNAGETFIPLEDGGGAGTAFSHWEESIFQSELMTGYASGGLEMSRMTIAAFKDLGYQVNFGAADAYTLPSRVEGLNSLVAPDVILGVI